MQKNLLTNAPGCAIIIRLKRYQHRDVAQLGSALGSGPRGRVFESPHSDQKRRTANAVLCFCVRDVTVIRTQIETRRQTRCVCGQSVAARAVRPANSPHSDQKRRTANAVLCFCVRDVTVIRTQIETRRQTRCVCGQSVAARAVRPANSPHSDQKARKPWLNSDKELIYLSTVSFNC